LWAFDGEDDPGAAGVWAMGMRCEGGGAGGWLGGDTSCNGGDTSCNIEDHNGLDCGRGNVAFAFCPTTCVKICHFRA
jgi:hypothetical protein